MADDMDPLFPDWYAEASPTAQNETVSLRWAGVAEAATSFALEEVPDLVRLFFALPARKDTVAQRARETFQKHDASFRMQGKDRELQVLAGCILAQLINTRPDHGDLVALAATCLGLRDLGDVGLVPGVLTRIHEYLRDRALEVRRRSVPRRISAPTLDFAAEIKAIEAVPANQANMAAEPLKKVLAKTADRLTRFGREVQASLDQQRQFLDAQDEELNILWWVLSGYSTDAETPFRKLKIGEAVLRAAQELADRTVLVPGPPSSIAFLDRILSFVSPNHNDSKLTVVEAIGRTPREWRVACSKKHGEVLNEVSDFVPLSFAIQRSLENENPDVWALAVSPICGIDPAAPRAPLHIATQHYHEILLMRAYSQARGPA